MTLNCNLVACNLNIQRILLFKNYSYMPVMIVCCAAIECMVVVDFWAGNNYCGYLNC